MPAGWVVPSVRGWVLPKGIRLSRPIRAKLDGVDGGGRIAVAGAEPIKVRVVRLAHANGLELPSYASSGSAGMDLRAAIEDDLIIAPGERTQIPTGLIIELPRGWEGQVRPRSGLAWRHGVTLLNSPGTIDSDYRGEVKVILVNLGQEEFRIGRGDRVAQLIVAPASQVVMVEASSLASTDRGNGGFGSTGVD